jgi:Fe-S-cluster containining protein
MNALVTETGTTTARLRVLDDREHFACGACSRCCKQPWRTSIEADKAEALRYHDFSKYPSLKDVKLFHPPADGRAGYFDLGKRDDDSCIFLDTDGLCIIHKELSYDAKPSMCMQFPYLPARTPTEDRVSLNFGCPAVQNREGPPLADQGADVGKVIPLSPRPANPEAVVPLDESRVLTWREYEALMDRLVAAFDADRPVDPWRSFAQVLTTCEAVRRFKDAGRDDDLVPLLRDDAPLPDSPDVPEIEAFARADRAPLAARMLFAATLYPDTMPMQATGKLGMRTRLMLIPRLMSLAKLNGAYPSRILARNISVDGTIAHAIRPELDKAGAVLLQRYLRSRFWMRLQVGNRVPVLGGVHQHILDFNAIIFLARNEALHRDEDRLTESTIAAGLTGVELHVANQLRLYDQAMRKWFIPMLDEPNVALSSLRLMALRRPAVA